MEESYIKESIIELVNKCKDKELLYIIYSLLKEDAV